MIVGPNKILFFGATALMCSASIYGAELSAPGSTPLTRVFTGEPNRLTLPPDFPDAAWASLDQGGGCAAHVRDRDRSNAALRTASTSLDKDCQADPKSVADEAGGPGAFSGVQPETRAKVEPVKVGGTVQSH